MLPSCGGVPDPYRPVPVDARNPGTVMSGRQGGHVAGMAGEGSPLPTHRQHLPRLAEVIWSTRTAVPCPVTRSGTLVVTSREHRWPPGRSGHAVFLLVPRVQAVRTRRRWLAGLRKP